MIDQFRGLRAPDPIGSALQGVGNQLAQMKQKKDTDLKLKGLLDQAQQGDVSSLAQLAEMSPRSAQVVNATMLQKAEQEKALREQQEADQQQELLRQANIATAALQEGEPEKIRMFLAQAASRESNKELQEELIDTANMDDDAMIFDLKSAMAESGRFNEVLQDKSVSQKEFEFLTGSLSDDEKQKAKRIKLGLEAREQGSSIQTILNKGTAEAVANVERILATGKETGKRSVELKFAPRIKEAIVLAEKQAQQKGEVFTDLKKANAAMPGLIDVVGQLKKLAPVATNTYTGKAFDLIAKELGFGSTKGATARAKYEAIINNQVLPLLKQTFGAAFTATEGQELKKTLGDINLSSDAKNAQLDAFIENKYREIEAKENELLEEVPQPKNNSVSPNFASARQRFNSFTEQQKQEFLQKASPETLRSLGLQ